MHKRLISKNIFGIVAICALMFLPYAMLGASLTTPRDYLNRNQENQTSGIQHEIFFTTAGAVSGGAGVNVVNITFPDGDDDTWCEVNGGLTVTGITNPTGGTESATSLPGTLSATCTAGAGGSSYDTISITGVDNLSAATKYGVRVTDVGVGDMGTPANTSTGIITITTNNGSSDVDTATTAVDIISDDQVDVSAIVPPSITFTLSSNSINLGTLSSGSVSTASHTVRTQTNAANGYTTLVYDDGNLRVGANDINDVGDGAVTAGSEEYGVATSDSGQAISQDAACGSAPYTASGLTTTQQAVAGETSGPADETSTICYAASISGTTVAGTYNHTVTFITVGLY